MILIAKNDRLKIKNTPLVLIWHFENRAIGLTDIVTPKFISGYKLSPQCRKP